MVQYIVQCHCVPVQTLSGLSRVDSPPPWLYLHVQCTPFPKVLARYGFHSIFMSIWPFEIRWYSVKATVSITDLHRIALQWLFFDSIVFCCYAASPRYTQCLNASAINCTRSAGQYSNCSILIFVRQDITVFDITTILLISTERGWSKCAKDALSKHYPSPYKY